MRIMIIEDLPKNKCTKCGSDRLKLDGNMSLKNPPRYFATCEDCGSLNLLETVSTHKKSTIEYDDLVEMIKKSLSGGRI